MILLHHCISSSFLLQLTIGFRGNISVQIRRSISVNDTYIKQRSRLRLPYPSNTKIRNQRRYTTRIIGFLNYWFTDYVFGSGSSKTYTGGPQLTIYNNNNNNNNIMCHPKPGQH